MTTYHYEGMDSQGNESRTFYAESKEEANALPANRHHASGSYTLSVRFFTTLARMTMPKKAKATKPATKTPETKPEAPGVPRPQPSSKP